MSDSFPTGVTDDFVDVPGHDHDRGDAPAVEEDTMGQNAAPNIAEQGNLTTALTAMADEFGAAAANRVRRADQLSGDSQAMWSIAMTSPTVMAAQGIRTMTESGSGRTRAETNLPAATSAAGNG